jgi:cytochrome c peroxidase
VRFTLLLLASAIWAQDAPRRVWAGPGVNLLGAPSPDGQWLSYVDAADLTVRGAAETRRLTHRPAGSKEFAYFSVFAPDSRRLAYAWFNGDGFYELRAVSIEGEAPKVVYRNEETNFVQPCAWSPDGSQILTLLFRRDNTSQIAWIPAAGGRPKILRSLPWIYPKKMDVSPDGRWIAYDRFRVEGRPERGVYLLAADGAQEFPLLDSAASALFPLWSPDGQRVLYVSEADAGLWSVRVADGKRAGTPQPIARDLGRLLPMAITRAGELYYGLRTGETNVAVAGGLTVKTKFPGLNSAPAWSPDGQTLAYLSRRGTENYGQESRVIVLNRPRESDERELPWSMALMEAVGWEGPETLLVSGADSKGREGTFRLELASGAFTLIRPERTPRFGDPAKAWTVGQQSNEVWKLKLPAPRVVVPAGLDAYLPVPDSNPLTPEKIALGKQLFFDQRLSRDRTIACSTCHQPQYAFSDPHPLSRGVDGRIGDRRSPRIANRAYGYSFFWDGRAKDLESQVIQPIENPKEMALPAAEAAARVGLSVTALQQALASYVRTILSGDSPFDRYLLGDAEALTAPQRAGLKLFRGKAGCAACHVGPNLTDEKLHDDGIGLEPIKTPSLRDVAKAPPYMHDGSLATLGDVLAHYQRRLKLDLDSAEKAQLEAFLHSLNGVITDGLP